MFKWAFNLRTEALFSVCLYVLGFCLKRLPLVPNKGVPWVVIVVGTVGGYFVFPPSNAPPELHNPELRSVMLGFMLGAGVWFFHDKFGRYLENFLPAFLKPDPERRVLDVGMKNADESGK